MNDLKTLLPMLGHTRGKRSAVTCSLKCDNACSKAVCNTSANSYFRDIASAEFSRRSALGLGLAGALSAAVVVQGAVPAHGATGDAGSHGKLAFTPIKPVDASVDAFNVPKGYSWAPVIRWGDPIFSDARVYKHPTLFSTLPRPKRALDYPCLSMSPQPSCLLGRTGQCGEGLRHIADKKRQAECLQQLIDEPDGHPTLD
jgi:hypothetical protein